MLTRFGRGARGQPLGAGDLHEAAAPLVRFAHAAEQRVDLQAAEMLVRRVLQLERDGRDQLVLAVDDAGVVPAGRDVGHLEDLDRSTVGPHATDRVVEPVNRTPKVSEVAIRVSRVN